MAVKKDAGYLPARLNLASSWMVAGDPVKALTAAEDALRVSPGSAEGTILRAVALYEFGKVNGVDASAKALALLAPLASGASAQSAALYDLAAIERELPGNTAYREHLETFLTLEKSGPYAQQAAHLLGKAPPATAAAGKRPGIKPPIPVGDVQAATGKALLGMDKRDLVVGSGRVSIYRDGRDLVLATDDDGQEMVQLVEAEQLDPVGVDPFRKTNGPPRRTVATGSGETLIYNGLSADVAQGQVRTLVFFAPK